MLVHVLARDPVQPRQRDAVEDEVAPEVDGIGAGASLDAGGTKSAVELGEGALPHYGRMSAGAEPPV